MRDFRNRSSIPIKPTCWRARKAGHYPAALGRAAAGEAGRSRAGPDLKENGASLYGRDPTKGFAEAVAWPVAGGPSLPARQTGSAKRSMRSPRRPATVRRLCGGRNVRSRRPAWTHVKRMMPRGIARRGGFSRSKTGGGLILSEIDQLCPVSRDITIETIYG